MDRLASKVAKRYVESKESTWEDFERAVDAALRVHDKLQKWISGFPKVLRQAMDESEKVGIPAGWVDWSSIHDYIFGPGGYESITWKTMRPLADRIEQVGWDLDLDNYLNPILGSLAMRGPHASNMETGKSLGTSSFLNGEYTGRHEVDGKQVVLLDVDRVDAWVQRLKRHSDEYQAAAKKALKDAKRAYKRKVKQLAR